MIRRTFFAALALVALCSVSFAQVAQPVKPATPGSVADNSSFPMALSATDRELLTAVRNNLITLAGAISNGKLLAQLVDDFGNLLPWASPASGLLQANYSVTTSATVCSGTDSALRGRAFKNVGTANICVALDSDGSPAVTCGATPNTPYVLAPGDNMNITKDDYTGDVYCISASGTQSLARNYVK